MPTLNLRNPLRRDPNRPTLKQRAATLKATAARLIRKPKPLPAAGSPEALAAFGAACRAVDHVMRETRNDDVPPIVPGRSRVWTSDTVQAVQAGNFSGLSEEEAAVARATPRARLEELLITTLRRELRMAEAVKASRIRELHALVYGDEPDPSDEDEAPAADGADPHLVAMVAEWQDVRRRLDDPAVLDSPEADALADGHSLHQLEIYRYPARSVLDLLAKVPVLRDELEDAKRGSDGGKVTNSLPINAWTGLLADIERIAGAVSAPDPAADADAELIALGRAFDAATVRDREANDALNAAEDRAEPHMPERPAALIYREGDNLFPLRQYGDAFAGIAVSPSDIEWMTRRPAQREVWVDNPRARPGWSMVPGKKPQIVHWPEAQARIDEIVAGWDAWHAEQDRVLDETGATEARNVTTDTSDAAAALARQISAQPARTVEGMRVKLRVAAFYCVCDPDTPEGEGYPGEEAIRSLYRDTPGIEISTDPVSVRIVPEA